MTEKTYKTLAKDLNKMLKDCNADAPIADTPFFFETLDILCIHLKRDNPRFNEVLFREAVIRGD